MTESLCAMMANQLVKAPQKKRRKKAGEVASEMLAVMPRTPDEAMSCTEICEAAGLEYNSVRRNLSNWLKSGRLKKTGPSRSEICAHKPGARFLYWMPQ